jgi:hypothetical protein
MERDPTELRLEDLAFGAGRIGGAPIHATLRQTRGFVELLTGFIAIDRVGEANGDVSRAAEALESIHPRRHRAGSSPAGTESDDCAVGGWPFRLQA